MGDLLLPLAISLEIGFTTWYLIMAIILFRSVVTKKEANGLIKAMAFLNVSGLLSSIWLIYSLFQLPLPHIAAKIPLDCFKAIIITVFMVLAWRD